MMKKSMLIVTAFAVLMTAGVVSNVYAQNCCPHPSDNCAPGSDKAMQEGPKEGNTWTTSTDHQERFTCPVCNMIHTVDEAQAVAVIDGEKYYLCHPSEQAKLRAGKETYLGEQFWVPGNLEEWSKNGATFRDPVNGQVATLSDNTPSCQIGHMRYFFVSEETKAQFESKNNTADAS